MINVHSLKVGDVCKWEGDGRRFVVTSQSDYMHGRYLDDGSTFHTDWEQSIVKLSVCWWMGMI